MKRVKGKNKVLKRDSIALFTLLLNLSPSLLWCSLCIITRSSRSSVSASWTCSRLPFKTRQELVSPSGYSIIFSNAKRKLSLSVPTFFLGFVHSHPSAGCHRPVLHPCTQAHGPTQVRLFHKTLVSHSYFSDHEWHNLAVSCCFILFSEVWKISPGQRAGFVCVGPC